MPIQSELHTGYIVNKFKLTDKIIDFVTKNNFDRRCVISLWQDDYLKTAVLPSCVWSSEWDVTDRQSKYLGTPEKCRRTTSDYHLM